MEKDKSIYVVEYSVSQKVFHIDKLTTILLKNREAVKQGRSNDFMIIGFGQSYEAASYIADILRKDLKLDEIEVI